MQSGGDAPHGVVPDNPSQTEGCDHLSEGGIWGDDAQSQTGGQTYMDTDQSTAAVVTFVCVCVYSSFPVAVWGKVFFLQSSFSNAKSKRGTERDKQCIFKSLSVMIQSFSEGTEKYNLSVVNYA